jgi:hypothetical protein
MQVLSSFACWCAWSTSQILRLLAGTGNIIVIIIIVFVLNNNNTSK